MVNLMYPYSLPGRPLYVANLRPSVISVPAIMHVGVIDNSRLVDDTGHMPSRHAKAINIGSRKVPVPDKRPVRIGDISAYINRYIDINSWA